jgi:hypothetical protein
VTGGYDPQLNQVVICHNRVWNKGLIRGVLAHEFLHMFDYCRAEMDFNNLEHIACSEVFFIYLIILLVITNICFPIDKSRQFIALLYNFFFTSGNDWTLKF